MFWAQVGEKGVVGLMLRSVTAEGGIAFELRVCKGEETEGGWRAIWVGVEATEVEHRVEVEVDVKEDSERDEEVEVGDY